MTYVQSVTLTADARIGREGISRVLSDNQSSNWEWVVIVSTTSRYALCMDVDDVQAAPMPPKAGYEVPHSTDTAPGPEFQVLTRPCASAEKMRPRLGTGHCASVASAVACSRIFSTLR